MGNEFGYLGKDLRDLARKLSINDERERGRVRERESFCFPVIVKRWITHLKQRSKKDN